MYYPPPKKMVQFVEYQALIHRVENEFFDTVHMFENQRFMKPDVEFEFALFFGRLIETSYFCGVKMNVLTLKN